jgi:methylated-DNA-[protein]-cysteine S-methyltransferase
MGTAGFIFETAAGFCALAWNDVGITRMQLPADSRDAAERLLLRRVPNLTAGEPTAEVLELVAQIQLYFAGERRDFSQVTVDLTVQDPFYRQVYTHVRRIGWGQTTTYGTVARELGAGPERARDVGQAMAANPIPLIIPCHRVLAAGGKLGGFSAPGGSAAKARMLALEGIALEPPPPAQQALF